MYTKEEIRYMIDNFRSICNTLEMILPEVDSNSIAQYGIESTLPKPQGVNSSKVESVVIAREKAHKHIQNKMDKIAFINECQNKLNEDDFIFLEIMKGYKRHQILPKPQGVNSSKVESVVIAREKAHKHIQNKMDKIAFINECQNKLNEDDFIFLEIMKGYKRHQILPKAEMNKNRYDERKRDIVNKIYNLQKAN